MERLGKRFLYSFKYSPNALIIWPSYLRNQISHLNADVPPSSPIKADIKSDFLTSDLETMKDLPFWRVQFSKYSLVIESHTGSK
jgi:hypothetical protein